jgi:large subunit ribosomal protein L13
MKSYIASNPGTEREWLIIDAADHPVGRLAARIADALRGKDKPTFTPHVDMGAFVIVINAEKVKLTGRKEEQKIYKRYTGYRSGLKEVPASVVREKNPERIVQQAVRGMLPKNNLSRRAFRRLKVYAGSDHPHAAQNPRELTLAS